MPHTSTHTPQHPSALEQNLSVAIVLWIMLAGICLIVANAWAFNLMPTV